MLTRTICLTDTTILNHCVCSKNFPIFRFILVQNFWKNWRKLVDFMRHDQLRWILTCILECCRDCPRTKYLCVTLRQNHADYFVDFSLNHKYANASRNFREIWQMNGMEARDGLGLIGPFGCIYHHYGRWPTRPPESRENWLGTWPSWPINCDPLNSTQ